MNELLSWTPPDECPQSSLLDSASNPNPFNNISGGLATSSQADSSALDLEQTRDIDAALSMFAWGFSPGEVYDQSSSTVIDPDISSISLHPLQPEQFSPSSAIPYFGPEPQVNTSPLQVPNRPPPSFSLVATASQSSLPGLYFPSTTETASNPPSQPPAGRLTQARSVSHYECQRGCSKSFKTLKDLHRHYKSRGHFSNDIKKFHCRCGYTSARKDHYRRHINQSSCHFNYKHFRCICSQDPLDDNLQSHLGHLKQCLEGRRRTGRPRGSSTRERPGSADDSPLQYGRRNQL